MFYLRLYELLELSTTPGKAGHYQARETLRFWGFARPDLCAAVNRYYQQNLWL